MADEEDEMKFDEEPLDIEIDEEEFEEEFQEEYEEDLTLADRIADAVTNYCGSWRFMGLFTIWVVPWILWNSISGLPHFDPFPFIFLTLLLSILAIVITSLVMIAQKRKDAKDQARMQVLYENNSEVYEMVEYLYRLHKKEEKDG